MSLVYDPKKVRDVVNGVTITGKAEDQFFQYEKLNDDFTPVQGADGETDYAEDPSNAYQVTLSIKHTSPSNKYLLGLAQDKTPISISHVDSNENGETFSAENGRIMKVPNLTLGKSIGTREWIIHFPSANIK